MTGSLQVKNGKYYMVINRNKEGVRKQKWIATGLEVKGNKKRAMEMMNRYLHDYEVENADTTKDILFSDYMMGWLENVRNSVKANTYHEYAKVVRSDVCPYFVEKGVMLRQMTNLMLQEYYNGLSQRMSGSSVLKRHANIHKALDYAVMSGLIDKNPADYVMLPKKVKFVAGYYTEDQLGRLLEAAQGWCIEPVIRLTAYYGLRRSEVLGLRWSDVDLQEGTIRVRNTVVSIAGNAFEKEITKTKSSYRTLPIDETMLAYLELLKKELVEGRRAQGPGYPDNDFVCRRENGQPFKPDYVTRTFKKILLANGLPVIRFHDLRHSSASMLLRMGFSLKEIQEWLGHSDIGTTSNCYSHLQYEAKRNMAAEVGKKLGNDAGRKEC